MAPDAVVIVATIRALKMHGGGPAVKPGLPLDEALRLESRSFHDVGMSEDLTEGTTAFREKREADFKGR